MIITMNRASYWPFILTLIFCSIELVFSRPPTMRRMSATEPTYWRPLAENSAQESSARVRLCHRHFHSIRRLVYHALIPLVVREI